jgi:positive regulator of sigma E activity
MIHLFDDPTVAVIGMLGLGIAGFALVKVYSKVISKLH